MLSTWTRLCTHKACLSFIEEENRKNRIPKGSPRTEPQLPEQPGQGTRARTEGQAAQRQNLTERNGTYRDDQPGVGSTGTEKKTADGRNLTERNSQRRPDTDRPGLGSGRIPEQTKRRQTNENSRNGTARADRTRQRPGPGPERKDKRHRNIPTERHGTR